MVIAINPGATFEYVLKVDRELPESEQTVWILRGLLHKERRLLEDYMTTQDTDGSMRFRMGTQKYEVLRAGIQGVRNLLDDQGREVVFESHGKGAHDKFLDRIADDWVLELVEAITTRSVVTTTDAD